MKQRRAEIEGRKRLQGDKTNKSFVETIKDKIFSIVESDDKEKPFESAENPFEKATKTSES